MLTVSVLYTKSWAELADVVLPNLSSYCTKNGYELSTVQMEEVFPGYEKIRKVLELFNGSEYVWVLDLDTLITNHSKRVEDFLDEENDLFLCEDVNGINCGSFICKNTQWATEFLNEVLSLEGENEMYCEQDAIRRLMSEIKNISKIKILSHPSINSYHYDLYPQFGKQAHESGEWHPGDLILHLPATPLEQRIKIFNNTEITW